MKWLYQFLFIDQKTKELSHTKFWSQVGYLVITWAFIHSITTNTAIDSNIWLIFGVVVIGNRTLKKALLKGTE